MPFTPQNFVNQVGPPVSAAWLNAIDLAVLGPGGAVNNSVNLMSFLSPAQAADVQAGTHSLDCSAAIQAACNSGAASIYVPPYAYRLSSGIQFNGTVLWSMGFLPSNSPGGARFIFDLSVPTCVTMGGPLATNQSAGMFGISILRASGSSPASSIGILNQNTYASWISHCASISHSIPINLRNDQNTKGICCYIDHFYTGAASDSHVVIDSWPESHWTDCRFGMVGSGDLTCNSYIRVQGGSTVNAGDGPDGGSFTSCQFNQGVNTGTNWLAFQNQLAGSIVIPNLWQFVNCYVEDNVVGVYSDATVTVLDDLQINNLTYTPAAPTQQFISLNAATQINDIKISTSNINGALTVSGAGKQINFLSVTASHFLGAVSLTGGGGSTAAFIGNTYKAGLALAGAWGALSVVGGSIVGGAFTSTATGDVGIVMPTAAPLNLYNLVNGAASSSPTLGTNGPAGATVPQFWMPIVINDVTFYIPCWT